MSDAGTSELEARIAKLEAENAALRSVGITATPVEGTDAASPPPRESRRRGRTVAAVVLVVVALLLAPVAVISAWARIQLVDTDQFVATFAPLAEEPAVQSYIGDQVTAAIEEQVDDARDEGLQALGRRPSPTSGGRHSLEATRPSWPRCREIRTPRSRSAAMAPFRCNSAPSSRP